jgi:Cu2+-exporting ATPase
VVAGSHNLSSTVQVRVQALGQDTRFGQIVDLMQSASTTKPRTAQLADRMAKPFLVGVLLAAVLACLWWWQTDPERALMVAVSVLVVTCPCALSLATPAAMLAAAGNMARSGVLVRNLQALEALSEVDTVVFDKTGTLTRDTLALAHVQTRAEISAAQAVQMASALAKHSLHPVSRALVEAGLRDAYSATGWSSEGVTERAGQGVEGLAAPVSGNAVEPQSLRLGSATFCGVTSEAADSPRVYLADQQGWLATFEVREELRGEAAAAITALHSAGLRVHLLSGDSEDSVRSVASDVGIAHARGGCSPADKLAALRAMQSEGQHVLMVGDGLNDGPVLAGAHVSFAFGKAVPLAQAQSDFVVLGDQLMSVVHSVLLARKTLSVVRQNLIWALLYNAACVPLAIAGLLPAWLAGLGMACSSLVVVANALRLSRVESLHKGI